MANCFTDVTDDKEFQVQVRIGSKSEIVGSILYDVESLPIGPNAIAGISIGVFIFLLIVTVLIVHFYRKNMHYKADK